VQGREKRFAELITPGLGTPIMCGIFGCVADEPVSGILLDGLRRVEYRGYDSAGMATVSNGRLIVRKGAGRISEIEDRKKLSRLKGNVGMAHTRWATHGGVTDRNAHPHTACNETVAVIHNGIIENYLPLKKSLTSRGHRFKSETDTEVIAHVIEEEYAKTGDPIKATMRATKKLTGQYAIAVLFQDRPDVLVGARKDAPLIVGVGDGKMFIASDVLAFIEHTDRTVFLDNQETVEITKGGLRIIGRDGKEVKRAPTQVAWELTDLSKADYAHYTLKEINEQPRTAVGASVQEPGRVAEFASTLKRAKSLFITGSGSSYHAGLLMKSRLNQEAGIRCDAVVSGELKEHSGFLGTGSVVVVLSQSGETADVLEAVKEAKGRGAKILSIVNAAGSTLARESDLVLLLNCGPEVGVAATKSFTAQVVVANMVVDAVLGKKRTDGIQELSEAITKVLGTEKQIKKIVQRYRDKSDFYFVARGYQSPVALEGALKLKELSYVHAEGMPASELKHGTLALIEKGTPVVVINPSGDAHADSLSNSEELKARGADLIGISDVADEVYRYFVHVPKVQPKFMPVVEVVPLQLLAYHFALARKNDPDYPRNLAKSVTVK
jgi:glucosamine--fructose-6-phosphate aminotransferase (isomerizing)